MPVSQRRPAVLRTIIPTQPSRSVRLVAVVALAETLGRRRTPIRRRTSSAGDEKMGRSLPVAWSTQGKAASQVATDPASRPRGDKTTRQPRLFDLDVAIARETVLGTWSERRGQDHDIKLLMAMVRPTPEQRGSSARLQRTGRDQAQAATAGRPAQFGGPRSRSSLLAGLRGASTTARKSLAERLDLISAAASRVLERQKKKVGMSRFSCTRRPCSSSIADRRPRPALQQDFYRLLGESVPRCDGLLSPDPDRHCSADRVGGEEDRVGTRLAERR